MNLCAGARVSPGMTQKPDPKIEQCVERMYTAMRRVIDSAPSIATGMVLGAVAGLTSDDMHAMSIVRLMVMARVFPEMEVAVKNLVDLIISDKVPAVRAALAG